MSTAVADIFSLLENIPAGAWVAVSESRHQVMAFGADALTVLDESRRLGEPRPVIVRVPERPSALFF